MEKCLLPPSRGGVEMAFQASESNRPDNFLGITRITIYKGMFYKSKYSILAKK